MPSNVYDKIRKKLFSGHPHNHFIGLLNDRAAIRGPVQGSPEDFAQILYELTGGDLNRRCSAVAYQFVDQGRKDLLKFNDHSLFRVVRTRGPVGGPLIVVTPHEPSADDLILAKELPLAALIQDSLKIRDAFTHIAIEYRTEERKLQAQQAVQEQKVARESTLEAALETIERAKSGSTIMIRGLQNIDELVRLGFMPGLIENPDSWIDADAYPGLHYRHSRSGIELLLTGREKLRPIEELNRLEFYFLVHRSDTDQASFGRMMQKFRKTRPDGSSYPTKEFHADLVSLVKYPEELKGRTESDLGLMADEVGIVIDRRQELDKGILPYEAVFRKDTLSIIEHIRANGTPTGEIRKALDYFEYTGMIDQQYKAGLQRQIEAALAAPVASCGGDVLYDKRVKEIVADVLKRIPKERLTSRTITVAMMPYVNELGFGKLVKIRERILQLKAMVREQ